MIACLLAALLCGCGTTAPPAKVVNDLGTSATHFYGARGVSDGMCTLWEPNEKGEMVAYVWPITKRDDWYACHIEDYHAVKKWIVAPDAPEPNFVLKRSNGGQEPTREKEK